MASRRFNQFVSSLEHREVCLDGYAQLAADATVATENLLGASVARTGVGLYSITLEDVYPRFLSCNVQLVSATNQAVFCRIKQVLDSSSVHNVDNNVKYIEFNTVNSSGVPIDVSVVCGLTIMIRLRNSVV